ncbi:hypothetical protein [Serratia quinivorans]|uniref:CDI toxin immunity protein n=1 Tax=Serratia quinivorans TaxID=137545 RepID=UPI002E7723FC|nr:hypothetical protein [Serratia quinivorans]
MTLFEECKEALHTDFNIVDGECKNDVVEIFGSYPFVAGNVDWSKIKHSDYESIDDILRSDFIRIDDVFVIVDDSSVPIFRTKLKLIAENVYDVTALSPKLFIFNSEIILQPLFPTEIFRLGIKVGDT